MPNSEHSLGSDTPSFCFRRGKSNAAMHRSESMAGRKAAHTQVNRAVTCPSDVTLESKPDDNAGATAASGCSNSVLCLVGRVEIVRFSSHEKP